MSYKNFSVSIFFNAHDLEILNRDNLLEECYEFFSKHIDVDKVYLETYRGSTYLSKEDMLACKNFFNKRGVKVSGAITTTQKCDIIWDFRSFCYSDPQQRKQLCDIVAYTAGIFDEIILDDFYFTNCKCDLCIETKGSSNWSDFRTAQMAEVSKEIMNTAKQINPSINMIIKYPNWYDHHQFTGYTPGDQVDIFDSFYTGTETRDSQYTQQVLQRYLGYFIMRYFESINPGKNLGGWFDTFDCSLNAYMEQLNMTVFARAREITLFCAGLLATDYRICVPVAGQVFSELDRFVGELGEPVGIPCYKPFKSGGEDFIHGYLGMLGLPLQPTPVYPSDSKLLLLTESAKKDPSIVSKIKSSLAAGGQVIITSGLLRVLNSPLSDIAEIHFTDRKALIKAYAATTETCSFKDYYPSDREIIIPHIDFKTNDTWPRAVGVDNFNNHPVLLENKYSKGKLHVLTIPDNPGDIYSYPAGVLNVIRETASRELPLHIEAPSQIGLFLYDNNTFIIESFRETNTEVTIAVHRENALLRQISTNRHKLGAKAERIPGNGVTYFKVFLRPGTYKILAID